MNEKMWATIYQTNNLLHNGEKENQMDMDTE